MGYLSVAGIIGIGVLVFNSIYFAVNATNISEFLGGVFWASLGMTVTFSVIACALIFIYYFFDYLREEIAYGI